MELKLEECDQTKSDNSKVLCLRFEKLVEIKQERVWFNS
jgi:hypothetical protein